MDAITTVAIGDVALVLVVSLLFGTLASRCGQPRVIGQILAGILLGPSVLGRLPGHPSSRLFPAAVLPSLTVLSQIAIVIFMFVVGYELDWPQLSRQRRVVPLIAASALVVPMALGAGTALVLKSQFAALGQPHVSRSFVLFMGVAVSITALPVLAMIVRERGMAGSTAGVAATAAAGIMDVAAWLILAVVLTSTVRKAGRPWPMTLVLFGCFAAMMLLVIRPALRRWMSRRRSVLSDQLPAVLALLLASAWVTASLGLHPVFGGFLAGLTMPKADGTADADVLRPMEQLSTMMLPLFFVVAGLSVNIGSLNGSAFVILAVICAVAAGGKVGPAYAASRVGGLSARDAITVGVLVNTRGLTELIALNVGLSAGLIGQRLYSVLVVMALLMTVVTAPLLSLVRAPARPPSVTGPRPPQTSQSGVA
jgi:Kef-type K+ transport system membrane component KefB